MDIFSAVLAGQCIPIDHLHDRDDFGRTPLHWASGFGHLNLVLWMVEQDADYRAVDQFGKTIIDIAHPEIEGSVRCLVELCDRLIELEKEKIKKQKK